RSRETYTVPVTRRRPRSPEESTRRRTRASAKEVSPASASRRRMSEQRERPRRSALARETRPAPLACRSCSDSLPENRLDLLERRIRRAEKPGLAKGLCREHLEPVDGGTTGGARFLDRSRRATVSPIDAVEHERLPLQYRIRYKRRIFVAGAERCRVQVQI